MSRSGGYGPVVTGGQMIIGIREKAAIAVTDLAIAISLGAVTAPLIGAWITYKVNTDKLKTIVGALLVIFHSFASESPHSIGTTY